jgi:hypothetical protein
MISDDIIHGVTDLLIRDIPEGVVAAIDARASRLGLSRTEYLRRRLAQDAAVSGGEVGVGDLERFAETFADLADPAVMDEAWR